MKDNDQYIQVRRGTRVTNTCPNCGAYHSITVVCDCHNETKTAKAIIKPKPVKERDTLDLLELVCQLHTRANYCQTKEMHDAYVEARTELENRIK